ncbi:mediator complex, subunit Med20 [Exophiala viscosa]|uniref:Mediator of RNA polymerase II transcription subunit 20 n=1 Tax=Exophiala viscosa TaxID=2486360 RepID=A0AAN6DM70_9EURO|nr:mediator complex, subunit Med20 [Exophiala viscosa]KAI1628499.1 mediator complex, subunit Med20 [Exophiala viscosa]
MSTTGLFLIPIPPNQQSPASNLISYISRSVRADLLPPFYLDHRLFVDTSSLLPNTDLSQRKFTSILTLSHTPSSTFVGTSLPKDKSEPAEQASPVTLITIPTSAADTFTQLIGTKLQPQWAHRQSLVVENGTTLSVKDGYLIVRIGDLKTPSRANQPSTLRAMALEITFKTRADVASGGNSVISAADETLIRKFSESMVQGAGISVGNSRSLFRNTLQVPKSGPTADTVDWDLAELYMDMLRGNRA